ncbi:DUF4394 domain-containing protein [Actinomadura rubrisoli]|uniref:DUF4394 domain-containing protein n=1 Tax=Actinomadura rubrisoli TaxID=2530368 RepID=UPI001A9CBB80|nr:DUF4394 domain-containing protein [Actinomadura rubrisoli]
MVQLGNGYPREGIVTAGPATDRSISHLREMTSDLGWKGRFLTHMTKTAPLNPDEGFQLAVDLKGTNFGVDFNPVADRLRVTSDTGLNLRHDLNSNTTVIDSPLSATGVSAAAYTDNDRSQATETTLFDVNTATDQVVIQSPPSSGSLVPTGTRCVDAGPNPGLDIFSDLSNGKTTSNPAFGTFIPAGGKATLYTVELLTGACSPVGPVPAFHHRHRHLTRFGLKSRRPTGHNAPVPRGWPFAVAGSNRLRHERRSPPGGRSVQPQAGGSVQPQGGGGVHLDGRPFGSDRLQRSSGGMPCALLLGAQGRCGADARGPGGRQQRTGRREGRSAHQQHR